MKHRIGDKAAFIVPPARDDRKSSQRSRGKPRSARFDIGAIKALHQEQDSYAIRALSGKSFLIPESGVCARVGDDLLEGNASVIGRQS